MIDLNSEYCVYWIRLPHMYDINNEGYVGVTSDIKRREHQHRHCCKSFDKSYNSEMVSSFNDDNYLIDVIFNGDMTSCYNLEYELRPNYNIGWNTRCGGKGLRKLAFIKSYSAFRRVRYLAKKRNLSVCESWCNSDGFEDFRLFYENGVSCGNLEMVIPKVGEVNRNTVRFISRSEMLRESKSKIEFFGDGEFYNVSDLANLLGIDKPNTLST